MGGWNIDSIVIDRKSITVASQYYNNISIFRRSRTIYEKKKKEKPNHENIV